MTNLQKIKKWGYSGRQYSILLSKYLDAEHTDAFYSRTMRILRGDSEPDGEEVEAMRAIEKDHANPHENLWRLYRLGKQKPTMMKLMQYAKSGIFNTTIVQLSLKKILKLVD